MDQLTAAHREVQARALLQRTASHQRGELSQRVSGERHWAQPGWALPPRGHARAEDGRLGEGGALTGAGEGILANERLALGEQARGDALDVFASGAGVASLTGE